MNKVSLKEFDKAINELPKTNDIVSTFSSVSVKELRKAVERFEYVPSFNDLLEENNRLNNIIDELEKWLESEIDRVIKLINPKKVIKPYGEENYYYENMLLRYKEVLDKLRELKR